MKKYEIAFLGAGIALLTAIILPIVAVYISTATIENWFVLYFGLSGLGFGFISIFLFRWGHNLLIAEQMQKMLDKSNN